MAKWVRGPWNASEPFPYNAYAACRMETGQMAYPARASVQGKMLNGHTTHTSLKAYVAFMAQENYCDNYEVSRRVGYLYPCWFDF